MPKVLVLLAAYNGEKWILQQCESILEQTGVDCRLVISDDQSTDGTAAILQRLQVDNPGITVLPPVARAGSAGKNFYRLIADVDIGDCDCVSFADQDDLWYPGKLSTACAALARTGAAGYSSSVRAIYENGVQHVLSQSATVTPFDFIFEGAGQGCTFVLTKPMFLAIQRIVRADRERVDQVNHHDWLSYALCRSQGFTWHFDPAPSMDYRQHDSNELGGRGSLAGARRRWLKIESGWYARQTQAVCSVLVAAGLEAAIIPLLQRQQQRHTPAGRVAWAWLLLRAGRRKLSDRLILFLAVCRGHL